MKFLTPILLILISYSCAAQDSVPLKNCNSCCTIQEKRNRYLFYVAGTHSLFTGTCQRNAITADIRHIKLQYEIRNGEVISARSFHPNGKIAAEEIYRNGRSPDHFRRYNPSGRLTYEHKRISRRKLYVYEALDSLKVTKRKTRHHVRSGLFNKRKNKTISHYHHLVRTGKTGQKLKKESNIFSRTKTSGGDIRIIRTWRLILREKGKCRFRIRYRKSGINIFP